MRTRSVALAAGVLAVLMATAPPAAAFPPEDAGYHDYEEMVAAIHEVAAEHPFIVRLFDIGESFEGRTLWAAKVSDRAWLDQREPEVVFDAGIHAREHMTVDVALTLLRALTTGYEERDPRIVEMVEERETFIFFNLNPDGGEFDHTSGLYQNWRKNRQPTPGTDAIGTDVNRNFGYQWGTSVLNADPFVETYRGPEPWSAPETRAFRDWVESRVIGGRQQILVHVTLHQFGRVVLYPFGYTLLALPSDMNADDRAVLTAMAVEMASLTGYAPAQSGVWAGVNVGNQMDWMYATHRIMTFTIEIGDAFYMPDEAIATETPRVIDAALYAIEVAACPYAVVGAESARCDDLRPGPRVHRDGGARPF